jgi:hypothetical protein
MFHSSESGSSIPQRLQLPPYGQSIIRVILLGDLIGVNGVIHTLAIKDFADANDWTERMPTGRMGEYITVHTKRMATPES